MHAGLLFWAVWSMHAVNALTLDDTPAISAEVITASDFLRLKQGDEDSKKLETKAKDQPKQDDSKNETKKPDNAPPPPPPQQVATLEPAPPPEPPKVAPPKPVEPDPIAEKLKEPPPPEPAPAPGPTPEEQKALDQKIEEQRKAEEAKKKAEEEALKKKLAEEARKKKAAEEAKRKAEEAKKKFDPNALAKLIDKARDDAPQKALIDKDPNKKGQQASGTSQTATATGKEAGTKTGADTVLSAREQDLLKGAIKSRLAECWRLPGSGGGTTIPIVKLRWQLDRSGNLLGEPRIEAAPQDEPGRIATETAIRAVKGCQPFTLPPDKYDAWKDIEWSFDPSQLL